MAKSKIINCRDCGKKYKDRRKNAGIKVTYKDGKKLTDTSAANCKHCGSGNVTIRHHDLIRNKDS